MTDSRLPLEIEILRRCGRRRLRANDHAALTAAMHADQLSWDRLLPIARRQGLLPLLAWHTRGVPGVPREHRDGLRESLRQNALRSLRATQHMIEIVEALEDGGVLAIPYKGPVLAQQLYGHLGLRESCDIDVLVRRDAVVDAGEILRGLGFGREHRLSPADQRFMLETRYDERWVRPGTLPLELHWGFSNGARGRRLTLEALENRLVPIAVGGKEFLALSPEDSMIVLAVHGAKHDWRRLEWICGVAELMRGNPALDWQVVEDRAAGWGVTPALRLAVAVAERYAEAGAPGWLLEKARSSGSIRKLEGTVGRILSESVPHQASAWRPGRFRHDVFQMRLRLGLLRKLGFLVYRLATPSRPEEWHAVEVGHRLFSLHSLLRPFQVARKVLRQMIQGSGTEPRTTGKTGSGRRHAHPGTAGARSNVAASRRSGTNELRVLQVVQRPQRRGAEVFAHELSEELERRGHRTRILYLYPFDGPAGLALRPGDRCLDGHDAHPLEFVPGIHPGLLRRLNEEIEDFRPDIVQANGGRTLKYAATARRAASRWKLVYRNIGLPSDWHRNRATIAAYRLAFVPQLDAVISVCRYSLDDATKVYAPSAPTFVIPNGIDGAKLDLEREPGATRAELGCSEDDFVLLFLGSLSRAKDPERFVRVAAEAARRNPSVQAWVVGDGPLRARLERQCRRLGLSDRCRFVGHQQEVAPYLHAADALVVPSATEGMPAVLLEAAYVGLPVVATRVGGIPECVVHGETGLLAETHSDEALVGEVMGLVSRPALRQRLAAEARRLARRSFTIEQVTDGYLGVYGQIAQRVPVAA